MAKVLCIGDIRHDLPPLAIDLLLQEIGRVGADLSLLNGTGLAFGAGKAIPAFERLFEGGVDLITLAETAVFKPSIREALERFPRLLRPLNLPPGCPGRGDIRIDRGGAACRVVVLSTPSDRRPLDDPESVFAAWLAANPGSEPILVQITGDDLSWKQGLVWRFAGCGRPVHWLGTGLGLPLAEIAVVDGCLRAFDLGGVGAEGNIEGLAPEIWWRRNRERLPAELVPPSTDLTIRGVRFDLDERGRAVGLSRVGIPPKGTAV